MAYSKINFVDNSPPALNADNLNNIQKQYDESVSYTNEAVKVKDSTTLKKYKWGMDNGQIFLEEV
jgi:hypothetical protein